MPLELVLQRSGMLWRTINLPEWYQRTHVDCKKEPLW